MIREIKVDNFKCFEDKMCNIRTKYDETSSIAGYYDGDILPKCPHEEYFE